MYENFAEIYSKGEYTSYSQSISEVFPILLNYLKIKSNNILDIACGEGTFCRNIKIQNPLIEVEGLDISNKMIEIANGKTKDLNLNIKYYVQNMIDFKTNKQYDLITSWFDSINYINSEEELNKLFKSVYNHLKKNGYFIFDINSIYALSNIWPGERIQNENEDFIEIHSGDFNFENNIATLKIIIFKKLKNGTYKKIEEYHKEKGYTLKTIKNILRKNNFQIINIYSRLDPLIKAQENDNRYYIFAKKD
ncbi:MAG: hypothetical protein PWP28_1831 [Oceanotoga sp.]|uniref:class I SAM-dependent DNA methyltransferase n=1 Tax=Oceanotoga sp. TaxID=2108366 RepID=UPI00265510C2|nr:class I SAM-dependent methyltransferase [Oceanotoga sp.]MDN5342956.1 hypothetical protein [Oceanotoga sp.]